MGRVSDPRKNQSGCWDFTAYDAMKNIEREKKSLDEKLNERYILNTLLNTIFRLCDKTGYRVVGRITLQHKKTGKIYK